MPPELQYGTQEEVNGNSNGRKQGVLPVVGVCGVVAGVVSAVVNRCIVFNAIIQIAR